MNISEQIDTHISNQTEAKRSEMETLHQIILQQNPSCKLWFLNGKDHTGKTVSNPNIGYGSQIIHYKDGTTKEFYQIGLSANITGISIYIMGIENKKFLSETYAEKLGKATVTGYCIKFKTIENIRLDVLKAAIRFGFEHQQETKTNS
jgi:hypothetical protein